MNRRIEDRRQLDASIRRLLSSTHVRIIGLLASIVTIVAFILALAPSSKAPDLIGVTLKGHTSKERAHELSRYATSDVVKKGFAPADYESYCGYAAQLDVYSCIITRRRGLSTDCESAMIDIIRVSPAGIVLESHVAFMNEIGKCEDEK